MADMNGLALEQLAANRREDALKGAKILGAELRFLDQRNQNMQVNPEVCIAFNKLLAAEKPDVLFGMWPLEFTLTTARSRTSLTMHGCRAGSCSGTSFARHQAVER